MKAFIPSWLDELGLTAQQFRVYCHLVRRADSSGESYPSLRMISEMCKLSINTVKKIIPQLEEKGLIKVRTGSHRVSNHYTLIEPSRVSNKKLKQSNGEHEQSNEIHRVSNETTGESRVSNGTSQSINPVHPEYQMRPQKGIQEVNPMKGANNATAPSPMEDSLPHQQMTMQELKAKVNGLKPEWGKPASWSYAEERLLVEGGANQLQELEEHDWQTLKRFLNAHHKNAKAYYVVRNRSRFVEHFSDVFASMQRWAEKQQIRPPKKKVQTISSGSNEVHYD